jgi:5-methylthioadenosine/S-adenosylhomocysteine deaminase
LVNGCWLITSLTTLNETELIFHAQEYASRIDQFLIKREKSVLSKLIAIGGATEGESFEVQSKVRIQDPSPFVEAIEKSELEILRHRHYHEFDTYFSFDDPERLFTIS